MGDDWKNARVEATVFDRLDDGRIAWMVDVHAPDGQSRSGIVDGVEGMLAMLRDCLRCYDDPAQIEPRGWEIRRDPRDAEPAFVVTPTACVDAGDGLRIKLGGILIVRGGRHDASALLDLARRQGLDIRPVVPPIGNVA
ncbi:MAG TPA: hypothetical protein VGQ20_06835 [Acidimicrobiales bacterium]|jgi:hypothetical protein|nr:hypothetical protein [Acidimicrobiales bacterium]